MAHESDGTRLFVHFQNPKIILKKDTSKYRQTDISICNVSVTYGNTYCLYSIHINRSTVDGVKSTTGLIQYQRITTKPSCSAQKVHLEPREMLKMRKNEISMIIYIEGMKHPSDTKVKQKILSWNLSEILRWVMQTEMQIRWNTLLSDLLYNTTSLDPLSDIPLAYFVYKAQITNKPTKNYHIYKMHTTFCLIPQYYKMVLQTFSYLCCLALITCFFFFTHWWCFLWSWTNLRNLKHHPSCFTFKEGKETVKGINDPMCILVLIQAFFIYISFSPFFSLHLSDFVLSEVLHEVCSMVEAMQSDHARHPDRNTLLIGFFMFSKNEGDTTGKLGVREESIRDDAG